DLIETAVHWRADRANALEESFVESIGWLSRIRHDTHQVDIFECAVYGLDHESAERSGSRVNAGRICEHDLRLWQLLDAGDARPRRLRTRRYNRHLFAEEAIQQCRLAHVGPSDQRDEPAPERPAADTSESARGLRSSSRRGRVCHLLGYDKSPVQRRSGTRRPSSERISRARPCLARAPLRAPSA